MGKYSTGKSLDIKKFDGNELPTVIKDWSDGDEVLEDLLWTCINNGVETTGSNIRGGAYLQISTENTEQDKIKKMLPILQELKGIRVDFHPDGFPGNVNGSDKWNEPTISFSSLLYTGRKDGDTMFGSLKEKLEKKNQENEYNDEVINSILNYFPFFTKKESSLIFDVSHTLDDKYKFEIHSEYNRRNWNYFDKLLEQCGLKREDIPESPWASWNITVDHYDEFGQKLKECADIITREYSLELPTEITDHMDYKAKALFLKRKSEESEEGKKIYDEWIENERIEHEKRKKTDKEKAKTKKVQELGKETLEEQKDTILLDEIDKEEKRQEMEIVDKKDIEQSR